MFSYETKNTVAKILVVLWIGFLVTMALSIAKSAVSFDPNAFFGLSGEERLPAEIIREIKVLVLMLSVSIVGGVSFIIKDFYRSVKYANIYDQAYQDYKNRNITREGFQKLATVEIYSGRFNYTWVYWFLIQPLLSSTLGIVAFFIARSGLGLLQGAAMDPDISVRSLYMYAVFTFLAGFSSHKFIAWLDRLADKIFSTTLPEEKLEKRAQVENTAAMDRMALKSEILPPMTNSSEERGTESQPKETEGKESKKEAKGMKKIR